MLIPHQQIKNRHARWDAVGDLAFNHGTVGGGLSVWAGDTDITAFNLFVGYNTASQGGGGIFCGDNTNSLVMDVSLSSGLMGVLGNSTEGNGGGAYISGCRFTTYVGSHELNEDIKGFNYQGYGFSEHLSSETELVFTR